MIVGKWSEGAILFGLPQTLGHDQWDMMSPADYMHGCLFGVLSKLLLHDAVRGPRVEIKMLWYPT